MTAEQIEAPDISSQQFAAGAWNEIGPKDSPVAILSMDLTICGQIHTLFAFCVFDPESLGWCSPGALAGPAYGNYGMIMWNAEHARSYVNKCLEGDRNDPPEPSSMLLPPEYTLVEDWVDSIGTIFTSDFSEPTMMINGLPYVLGLLPTGERTGVAGSVEIGQLDFLPYPSERAGYREALIRIDGHLIKLKAFQVLESKSRNRTRTYSTGEPMVQDWLQQFSYTLDGYYEYLKPKNRTKPTVSVDGHNYMLFGVSAVEHEESRRRDEHKEESDVRTRMTGDVVEYRFDPGMPEEWPLLIEHLADQAAKDAFDSKIVLSRTQMESVLGELSENPLGWLNFLTGTASVRYSNWFSHDEDGELETKPARWSLCLDWTEEGSVFVCQVNEDTKHLLKNLKKGEAVKAVETGCPLRITVG